MDKRSLAPLTGALFVVLVIVAFIPLGGDTPDGDASAAKVVSFYSDHDTRNIIAAVLLVASTVPLLYFVALVRDRFSAGQPGHSALPGFAFGAGVATAAGFLVAAGIHFALADLADDIRPVAAQALNALDSDSPFAFSVPLVTLVFAASLMTLRTTLLPRWLGWVGIVLFIVSFTPVGFIAFGLSGIWIIVVSILFYVRGETPAAQSAAAGPATPD